MSLNAQAIAVSGYGYGAQLMAVSGYGDVAQSVAEQYSGGWEYAPGERKRTKEDIRKARKEYGLAFEVIETVALRQSENLQTDEQKIFDELQGELKLQGLEFESKHLEYLNDRREALVSAEIGRLLKLRIQQEDEDMLMLLASMVANRMI